MTNEPPPEPAHSMRARHVGDVMVVTCACGWRAENADYAAIHRDTIEHVRLAVADAKERYGL